MLCQTIKRISTLVAPAEVKSGLCSRQRKMQGLALEQKVSGATWKPRNGTAGYRHTGPHTKLPSSKPGQHFCSCLSFYPAMYMPSPGRQFLALGEVGDPCPSPLLSSFGKLNSWSGWSSPPCFQVTHHTHIWYTLRHFGKHKVIVGYRTARQEEGGSLKSACNSWLPDSLVLPGVYAPEACAQKPQKKHEGFPLVLLALGVHICIPVWCDIQRRWWHFCIFNHANNQNLRPSAHHLCWISPHAFTHFSSPSHASQASASFLTLPCNLFIWRCTSVSFNHLNRPLVPI